MVLAKLKSRSLLFSRKADCTKYAYDQAQNRKLMIDSNARTTYTCDVANQLNWLVDGTGRTTFAYDNNGNQTLELVPALTRTTNVWDCENRLILVKRSSTDRSTYTYKNENNLRVVAEEPSAVTSKIIWDGQSYLIEANSINVTQAAYTNEPSWLGKLVSQQRTGTSYYHSDIMGSVVQLSDSNAIVTDSSNYRAFGEKTIVVSSTVCSFGYKGVYGLYLPTHINFIYDRERYLSLRIGSFIASGFLRFSNAINNYSYMSNNPLFWLAPFIQEPWITPDQPMGKNDLVIFSCCGPYAEGDEVLIPTPLPKCIRACQKRGAQIGEMDDDARKGGKPFPYKRRCADTIEQVCQMIQNSKKGNDRITIFGHCGGPRPPGVTPCKETCTRLTPSTIPEECIRAINEGLTQSGIIRLCACGLMGLDGKDRIDRRDWFKILQDWANRTNRKVCMCLTQAAFHETKVCACHPIPPTDPGPPSGTGIFQTYGSWVCALPTKWLF